MHSFTLPENAKLVGSLKPATDAAGRTGRYISIANLLKVFVVFHIDQGNAATIALDFLQATSNVGAGAKAVVGNRRTWTNLDLVTNDTIARQVDAQSYTTDAGVKEKQVVLELLPSDLDLANGFVWIAPRTGASNVANLTQAMVYGIPAYPGAGQPSATV
jgi:hypothetical protein